MGKEEMFRWRGNPGIIAQYFLDRKVKHGEKVVLKPNEACVVVENGRIVGISTQTKMEVNPKVGMLSRIFGSGQPSRAFLFVMLGPHNLLLRVGGKTSDGHELNGMVSIKVEFSVEDLGKLLQFPAKGEAVIGIDHIINAVESQVHSIVGSEIIGPNTLEEIRTNPELQEDLAAAIIAGMKKSMGTFGLSVLGTYANWNETEFERLLVMQDEVNNIRKENGLMEEKAQLEMEVTLNKRKREMDLLHKLHVQDLTMEAQRNVANEIAQLKAQKDVDDSRWDHLKNNKLQEKGLQHQLESLDMEHALKAAEHDVEMAKKDAEVAQIKHEQEFGAKRDNVALENQMENEKVGRTMSMFEQVQENKRKRMEKQGDLNLKRQSQSDQLQAEMMRLAAEQGALDPEVMKEFLKQQSAQKSSDGSGSALEIEGKTKVDEGKDESGPVLSPDGKWIWNGSDWIPNED